MRLRRAPLLTLAALACLGLGLWATGGFAALTWWAADRQRALHGALAADLTALREGESTALWGLMALCAAYGFLHALGPGHGKALIAGAAIGTRANARRMAAIALAGSLAQAAVAIGLAYGGLALLDITARGLAEGAERWIAPIGALAIAVIGAWIFGRGLRDWKKAPTAADAHVHGPDCGHRHGPTPEQAARATSFGETLGLVTALAARPCSGAIFVLIIAWRMDLAWAGAGAAAAMGLGTAALTALTAWLAVTSRDAAFRSAGSTSAVRRLAPGLQILAGGVILAVAALALLASMSGGASA